MLQSETDIGSVLSVVLIDAHMDDFASKLSSLPLTSLSAPAGIDTLCMGFLISLVGSVFVAASITLGLLDS